MLTTQAWTEFAIDLPIINIMLNRIFNNHHCRLEEFKMPLPHFSFDPVQKKRAPSQAPSFIYRYYPLLLKIVYFQFVCLKFGHHLKLQINFTQKLECCN